MTTRATSTAKSSAVRGSLRYGAMVVYQMNATGPASTRTQFVNARSR